MRSFKITLDIYASRIGNSFGMKVTRNIDVDNDQNLDEIMDIPIGKLILGSSYAPRVSDIADVSTEKMPNTDNRRDGNG